MPRTYRNRPDRRTYPNVLPPSQAPICTWVYNAVSGTTFRMKFSKDVYWDGTIEAPYVYEPETNLTYQIVSITQTNSDELTVEITGEPANIYAIWMPDTQTAVIPSGGGYISATPHFVSP